MSRHLAFRRYLTPLAGRVALGAVVLGCSAPLARAQGAPPPAPPAAEVFRWVVPGDSLLRGARVQPGVARYSLTAYRDADEFPVGRIQDEVTVDSAGGVPVLRRVQQLQRGGPNGVQRITDSSTTELLTLAPRWHRSEQPTRRITVDFAGRRLRALVGLPDASPAVIDTTVARAPFDSGNWDLLLRALPLERGLRVRFLVYDTDAGVHEYRLAVTGTATILGEEAHVVTFALSRTTEAVVWVSKATGQLLQMETMIGGNTLLRQVRLPSGQAR